MKSSRPSSAHWRSSNTRTTTPRSAMRSKKTRHAAKSDSRSVRSAPSPASRPSSWSRRGLHPAALRLVGDPFVERGGQLRARGRRLVRLGDAGTAADHLRQRPEADSLAVRRRPALVPVDDLGDAVDVLLELPDQPALADAALADDRHQPRPPLGARRDVEVLEHPQLRCRARRTAPRAARCGPRRRGGPRPAAPGMRGTGAALPLSSCSPAGSKAMAPAAACIVDSPTRTVPGGATDWRRDAVLTRSPATMPWFVAPRVTAASPVRTPARSSQLRADAPRRWPARPPRGRARCARRARRRPRRRSARPRPP